MPVPALEQMHKKTRNLERRLPGGVQRYAQFTSSNIKNQGNKLLPAVFFRGIERDVPGRFRVFCLRPAEGSLPQKQA